MIFAKMIRAASAALVCLMLPVSTQAQEDDQMDPSPFYLGPGDPVGGRLAYMVYGCVSCHRVPGDQSMPPPAPGKAAPILKFGPETPDYVIAQAIVAPSHKIAEGFGKGDPEDVQKSPMRDYSDALTIRNLRDIVAYLKSLKER